MLTQTVLENETMVAAGEGSRSAVKGVGKGVDVTG